MCLFLCAYGNGTHVFFLEFETNLICLYYILVAKALRFYTGVPFTMLIPACDVCVHVYVLSTYDLLEV